MIPRYTLPEMGAIWSDVARFEAMLRVELAVARAQAARGQIPAGRPRRPRDRGPASMSSGSPRSSGRPTTTSSPSSARSPRSVGPEGRFLHLGLTSSDVVDTGLALQLRAAGERLLLDLDRLLGGARQPRSSRGRDGDDGSHAFGPRRADDARAQAGRLGVRGRAGSRRAWRSRSTRSRPARSPGRSGPTATSGRTSRRRCWRRSGSTSTR